MSPDELEIQKIFVNVFEELKHEQKITVQKCINLAISNEENFINILTLDITIMKL